MTDLARKIREGDLRALARTASGVENRDPQALALLHELSEFAGHARIVGITGPPGAGKSTLVDVAMLPAGESRIELLEPTAPDSPIAKFLAKRGPGLHHVALRVPDLDAAIARLTAQGARLLNEPRRGAGGHLYVFVHPASTGGVLLELIQEQS